MRFGCSATWISIIFFSSGSYIFSPFYFLYFVYSYSTVPYLSLSQCLTVSTLCKNYRLYVFYLERINFISRISPLRFLPLSPLYIFSRHSPLPHPRVDPAFPSAGAIPSPSFPRHSSLSPFPLSIFIRLSRRSDHHTDPLLTSLRSFLILFLPPSHFFCAQRVNKASICCFSH